MNESLIQQYYLNEDGFFSCKVLSLRMIMTLFKEVLVPANTRASSRGNTGGASVIWHDWA
jgi:hypothetical protein